MESQNNNDQSNASRHWETKDRHGNVLLSMDFTAKRNDKTILTAIDVEITDFSVQKDGCKRNKIFTPIVPDTKIVLEPGACTESNGNEQEKKEPNDEEKDTEGNGDPEEENNDFSVKGTLVLNIPAQNVYVFADISFGPKIETRRVNGSCIKSLPMATAPPSPKENGKTQTDETEDKNDAKTEDTDKAGKKPLESPPPEKETGEKKKPKKSTTTTGVKSSSTDENGKSTKVNKKNSEKNSDKDSDKGQ